MSATGVAFLANDEAFVALLANAKAEPELAETLRTVLRLDTARRIRALDAFLVELERQGAPAEYRQAFAYFKDDAVARRALELL